MQRLADIEKDVQELYLYQNKKAGDQVKFDQEMTEFNKAMKVYKQTGAKAPVKPMKRVRHPPDKIKTRVFLDRRKMLAEAAPEFVSEAVHRAKLSYVDANGENILPEDDVGGEQVESDEDDNEENEGEEDKMESAEEHPLGLKLRVWDRTASEGFKDKGLFLGQITLSTDDILRPPSGIRTYPLKTDANIIKNSENTVEKITGSITIVIKVSKKDKNNDDRPLQWKMEVREYELCLGLGGYSSESSVVLLLSYSISSDALGSPDLLPSCSTITLASHNTIILTLTHQSISKPLNQLIQIQRMSRLAVVDRLKLTSPYVEVMWCGPGVRDGTVIDFKRWLSLGETVQKKKATDPQFNKKEDFTVYVLICLCYPSMPMCHVYHISHRVVHWRALIFSYRIIQYH